MNRSPKVVSFASSRQVPNSQFQVPNSPAKSGAPLRFDQFQGRSIPSLRSARFPVPYKKTFRTETARKVNTQFELQIKIQFGFRLPAIDWPVFRSLHFPVSIPAQNYSPRTYREPLQSLPLEHPHRRQFRIRFCCWHRILSAHQP